MVSVVALIAGLLSLRGGDAEPAPPAITADGGGGTNYLGGAGRTIVSSGDTWAPILGLIIEADRDAKGYGVLDDSWSEPVSCSLVGRAIGTMNRVDRRYLAGLGEMLVARDPDNSAGLRFVGLPDDGGTPDVQDSRWSPGQPLVTRPFDHRYADSDSEVVVDQDGAGNFGCNRYSPALPGYQTGRVTFTHPAWGPVTLVTTVDWMPNTGGHIFVVDTDGRIIWEHELTAVYTLETNTPPRDTLGHIFLNYNPGRYNGVIVLKPTASGFEDFETLPAPREYDTRFYYAEVAEHDADGVFEVDVSENDCDPSCADGAVTAETYRWNGNDYVGQS